MDRIFEEMPNELRQIVMSNLKQNSVKVRRDMLGAELLNKAQNVIVFDEYMSKPYLTTTQNQRYLTNKVPKNAKSACVILGAGDTIFQLISQDIEKIVALDTNNLQECIFRLRKAAIMTLSNEEFEAFLLDIHNKRFLSQEVYQTVKEGFLKSEEAYKNFWEIFLKLNPKEDITGHFIKGGVEQSDIYRIRYALPYIKRKSVYYSLRDKIEKCTIEVRIEDVYDYFRENPGVSFDYIDITNTLLFTYQNNLDEFPKIIALLRAIYENNLKINGTFVLDYMFGTELKNLECWQSQPLTDKDEFIKKIYSETYRMLNKVFDLKVQSVEACCPAVSLKGNHDSVIFVTKCS